MKIALIFLAIIVLGAGLWWYTSQDSKTNQYSNQPSTNSVGTNSAALPTNVATATNTSAGNTTTSASTVPANAPDLGQAPAFSLKDYSGATVTLEQYAGKPLVINSWAAWCPYCIDELPDFAAVQRELGDKITIIAINRAESLGTAKRYSDNLGVTASLVFLLDPSDSFYSSIGGFSMPETIIVDANGTIRDHIRGPINKEMLKSKLSEGLGVN